MKHKKRINAVVLVICVAMAFFIRGKTERNETDPYPVTSMALTLTQMAVPMAAVDPKQPEAEGKVPPSTEISQPVETPESQTPQQNEEEPEPVQEIQVADSAASGEKPQVLIYHTHTTESYQPVTEGNFHSVNKTGTVREVGDMLALRLEQLGYKVIHDETIHDHPSYSQSYSRSLETAKSYLNQYPQIALVVDLHRDAAGYPGSVGKVHSIEGKNTAAYGYVIGQGNPNLTALQTTVEDLNRTAEALYPGFTGKIIDKEYKFNQYISDHHVLVEVGNNENTIEQAKMTGYYLAEIFAAYLKERGV
ncbi:MAG: stage II sporulation protein P [Firmicutes bacterium]|nr:stage II sporulation protein P [Bacillota bacterium]MBR7148503.1 stage II sporulation protein P [Bacillota bacterium]